MKGKYVAKVDVNDLAKKGDVVTLVSVNEKTVEFNKDGRKFVMDKTTFFSKFTPQTTR